MHGSGGVRGAAGGEGCGRAADALVERARAVTARFPRAHGAPLTWAIRLRWASPSRRRPGAMRCPAAGRRTARILVCGVTPQAAAEAARIPLMLTHAPAHMLITDLRVEDLDDG